MLDFLSFVTSASVGNSLIVDTFLVKSSKTEIISLRSFKFVFSFTEIDISPSDRYQKLIFFMQAYSFIFFESHKTVTVSYNSEYLILSPIDSKFLFR